MHDDTHHRASPEVPAHAVASHAVADPAMARRALAALDAVQEELGMPLVDEVEQHRLEAAAAGRLPEGWAAVLATRDGTPAGYGAVHLAGAGAQTSVTGDAAAFPGPGRWSEVLVHLVAEVHRAAGGLLAAPTYAPPRLSIWVRHVAVDELTGVRAAGFDLDRRLGVLGRALSEPIDPPPAPAGISVRPFRPDVDDDGVVAVLADAYAGTDDGGWDLDRLRERRALSWFRAEDLLVAVDGGGAIVGVGWLKRRDATTGEIYNLAIHPGAQGRGLGPYLLAAGLEHLRVTGCDDVLLWVDLANERAVALYHSLGFHTLWEDVALGRDLGEPTSGA